MLYFTATFIVLGGDLACSQFLGHFTLLASKSENILKTERICVLVQYLLSHIFAVVLL